MAGNVLLLGVLTEQSPFGMSRVQRFCTRYGLPPSHPFKNLHPLSSCPVIGGRSHPSTSTQRNQSVSRSCSLTLRLLIRDFSVLTGGKDGIILVGEIEHGISV